VKGKSNGSNCGRVFVYVSIRSAMTTIYKRGGVDY